jgi:hypothetical protein
MATTQYLDRSGIVEEPLPPFELARRDVVNYFWRHASRHITLKGATSVALALIDGHTFGAATMAGLTLGALASRLDAWGTRRLVERRNARWYHYLAAVVKPDEPYIDARFLQDLALPAGPDEGALERGSQVVVPPEPTPTCVVPADPTEDEANQPASEQGGEEGDLPDVVIADADGLTTVSKPGKFKRPIKVVVDGSGVTIVDLPAVPPEPFVPVGAVTPRGTQLPEAPFTPVIPAPTGYVPYGPHVNLNRGRVPWMVRKYVQMLQFELGCLKRTAANLAVYRRKLLDKHEGMFVKDKVRPEDRPAWVVEAILELVFVPSEDALLWRQRFIESPEVRERVRWYFANAPKDT